MSVGPFKKISVLGVRIDAIDWSLIDQFCRAALAGDKAQQIVTVNGEFILEAQQNQTFKDVVNTAELVIPDSTNVVWASHWQGEPLPMVTPGSDLALRLANVAADTNYSIYLLGGRGGVAARAAETLQEYYPNLKIAGWSEADPNDPAVASQIKESKAAIVLVAYGAPKQELWIAEHKNQTGAKILVGIGGTFDMLSGRLPRAPKWIQQIHLEWLWRLLLEPQRFGRVWNAVVVFPLRVLFK